MKYLSISVLALLILACAFNYGRYIGENHLPTCELPFNHRACFRMTPPKLQNSLVDQNINQRRSQKEVYSFIMNREDTIIITPGVVHEYGVCVSASILIRKKTKEELTKDSILWKDAAIVEIPVYDSMDTAKILTP